jgi:hypothetical protein
MKLDANELPAMLDELFTMWGGMHGAQGHHANCRAHSDEIVQAFETSASANEALSLLLHIEGIGLSFATGILWAAYPDQYVPLDKKTMGYCLREQIVRSDRITSDYEKVCRKVVDAVVGSGKDHPTIKDLVHDAEATPEMFWCPPR